MQPFRTIVLTEHQCARIGPKWHGPTRVVSRREVVLLDQYQRETGQNIFDIGYRTIKARNWVGTIGLGDKCIEVVPKTDANDEKCTRANLLVMLARSGIVPMSQADIAWLANYAEPLIIAYMNLFVERLGIEWRRGRIRHYIPAEENRPYLRGKLLVARHVQQNLIRRERFYTSSDEFTEDNLLSRLLKAALDVCLKQCMSGGLARKAAMLMHEFDEVEAIDANYLNLDNIVVSRQHHRFAPVINMAGMILRNSSPSSVNAQSRVFSLMFDMNVVYERFIAGEFKKALLDTDFHSKSQVSRKHLLKRGDHSRFLLKPDIGIYRHGSGIHCLIDTKWKMLDMGKLHEKVGQGDIYQMYAYGKEYGSPATVLLYPRCDHQPYKVADYEHQPSTNEVVRRILIRTIDLSASLANAQNLDILHQSLRNIALEFDDKFPETHS